MTETQPRGDLLKVREMRFLEHEVYQLDDALQAGIAALPADSIDRQVLADVLLMLRTAEPKEALFPTGFLQWVNQQVASGAVDGIRQAVEGSHEGCSARRV